MLPCKNWNLAVKPDGHELDGFLLLYLLISTRVVQCGAQRINGRRDSDCATG